MIEVDADNFGYLIHIVNTLVGKYSDKLIHETMPEVTGVQFIILIYLYHHRSRIITQRMITNHLHLRHPTVRHIIKLMLEKRLIVSGALPSDHRQVQVMISQHGDRLIKQHLTAINRDFIKINGLITSHVSNNDQRILKQTLKQIIKNFQN